MLNLGTIGLPLIVIASWLLATLVARGRARAGGFPSGTVGDLSWWVAIGALVGARSGYVLAHWPLFLSYPQDVVLTLWHGLSFYGGMIGAIAAGVLFARRRGLPVWPLAGAVAPAIPLGIALARLGFFGLDVWNLGLLGRPGGLPVSLTADLVEALLCLGLFVTVSYRPKPGAPSPFLLALTGYGLLRAVLDFARPQTASVGPIGDQWLALGLAMAGIAAIVVQGARKGTGEPA